MKRQFWLASGVIFLDEVVYTALVPLLPSYAHHFALTATEIGLLVGGYPLLMLLSSLPAGILTDRLGARRPLLVGSVLLIVATLGFAYAGNAWELWSARALQGLASGFASVAGMALIAHGATASRRGTVIGLAGSLTGLSTLAGPAVGGFAAPALGVQAAFLLPVAFGSLVLVGLLCPGWREPALPRPTPLRATISGLLRSPPVRSAALCILAVGFVGGAVQTLAPLSLGAAGYSPSDLGSLYLIGAIVSLAGQPIAGRLADQQGPGRVATIWALLIPLLVLGLALARTAWVLAAVLVALLPLLRVGGSLGYVVGAEHAPLGAGLAAGFGLTLTAWSVGATLGPLVAGALADASGNAIAYAIVAVVAGLFALAIAVWHPPREESLAVG